MRKKRIIANLVSALTGRGVDFCSQFLVVPAFLKMWGVDYYGAWLVLSAVPSVLAMSNLGVGTASSQRIIIALGQKDERKANSLLATSLLFIAAVGVLLLAGLIMSLAWLPLPTTSHSLIEQPHLVLVLLLVPIVFTLLGAPFEGFWVGRQKAAIGLYLNTLLKVFQFAVVLGVVFAGGKALMLASVQAFASLVWLGGYLVFSFRLLKGWEGFAINKTHLPELLHKGVGFQASAVWQALFFQGSLWLANFLLGPAGAATWGTVRTLTRAGNQFLTLINQTITPELQVAVGRGEYADARRLHSMALIIAVGVGLVGALGLAVAGGSVYNFWTHGKLAVPGIVWPIMAMGLLFNALWWTSSDVHRAFNQPWRINLFAILAAVISLGTMTGAYFLGVNLVGFAIGSVVFDLLLVSYVLRRSLFLLEDNFTPCMKRGFECIREYGGRARLKMAEKKLSNLVS